jgi:uncharacterized repeat protein (TIGR01451 family)
MIKYRRVVAKLKITEMFEKLLAVLPYNPGLAEQVSFYGRRMREEATIRRTGMIFIVLAFMIQFFAVLNPPKPAAAQACSGNDLVYCGISNAQEAANKCNANIRGYGKIMDYYGIPCSDIANAPDGYINQHDHNNQLFSLGNNAYGKPGETAVGINPGNPVFWRYLWGWNITKPIHVLRLSEHGQTFFIMFDCGNLVSIGIPQKYTPPPPQHTGLGQAQPVSKPKPAPTPAAAPAPTPTPTPPPPPTPCQYDSSITADNTSCKPCEESNNGQDTASCVTIRKTAANNTTGAADANNTTANPGDVITYTLYAKNNGKAMVKNYLFEENLDDVLVYADTTDLHGGTMDNSHKVAWPATFIDPGKTVTVQITVKVKNPVPQTPVTQNDPNHFDLIMTNVYGNTVNIHLPGSPQKTVEAAAATLPNTGPGTSLFIGSVIVVIGGYFYGRTRLLAKESNLALQESTGA